MKKLLEGKSVIVTRAKNQSEEFINKLENLGAKLINIPVIEIKPLIDTHIENVYKKIQSYNWIIFTSTNTIEIFFKLFDYFKCNKDILNNIKYATVGNKTSLKLLEYGFKTSLQPEKFTADDMMKSFVERNITSNSILIPCSKLSKDILSEGLKSLNNNVTVIHIYDNVKTNIDIDYNIEEADYITFTSPSTVKNFCEIFYNDLSRIRAKIICIGTVTADKAREMISIEPIVPEVFNIDGMIQKIIENEKSPS